MAEKPPTVGAAIIARDDLERLQALLAQLQEFDQVVVVDTGSRDGTIDYLRKLGSPFEAHVFSWRATPAGRGQDEWGFAAARNESFRLLETSHAVWLDSDDLLARVTEGKATAATASGGAEAFRNLIRKDPDADAWILDYHYRTNRAGKPTSVLAKERLLNLATGWRWRYPVHEVLEASRPAKLVNVLDLVVQHQMQDVGPAIRRNGPMLRTWLRQLERQGGPRADLARARRLYGASLRAQGQHRKAADWLLGHYLAKHPELPAIDKWAGWIEACKSLLDAGDNEDARIAALQAIALRPGLPDGHVLLAEIKAEAGEPPGDVLKLLEFAESCREVDYVWYERNPLVVSYYIPLLAAECHLRLDHPQLALLAAERARSQLPDSERAERLWDLAARAARERMDVQDSAPAAPALVSGAKASPPPVFVINSGRCGSTLLSNMLRLNPAVLSLSELLVFLTPGAFASGHAPIYAEQFWSLLSTPRKRLKLMIRHGIPFEEVLYRPGPGTRYTVESGVPPLLVTALPHLTDDPEALFDEIGDFVRRQGVHPVAGHYRRLFDWLKDRFGRQLWVERSGSSVAYLSEIIDKFPDARIVHLFRDGRETAISMQRHSAFRLSAITGRIEKQVGVDPFNSDEPMRGEVSPELRSLLPDSFDPDAFWSFPLEVEDFGRGWAAGEASSMSQLASLPSGRVLHLRYENLVAAPEAEVSRLSRFIGLPEVDQDWLKRAAALVRIKPPAWPQLPEEERKELQEACRLGLGLLYGTEDPLAPEPAGVTAG